MHFCQIHFGISKAHYPHSEWYWQFWMQIEEDGEHTHTILSIKCYLRTIFSWLRKNVPSHHTNFSQFLKVSVQGDRPYIFDKYHFPTDIFVIVDCLHQK